MFNRNIILGKWNAFKGDLLKSFGQLQQKIGEAQNTFYVRKAAVVQNFKTTIKKQDTK